ncbi:common plant regulatory factor 1-like isoform X2 [Ananas comosus]|uniref:Common plant regulatory factor 1-like isoform X2 n=1 Tax=Ananas comosus TaxID=4615 RepID=A0A6P5FS15_ANACO|nr:common plant regulatory factor 1-like isoform X2 [Ananas comosus]
MGNEEAAAPPKSDKSASPVQDQPVVYPYPDWAAMQAYYGPGVMPPPYFGAAVAPGHAPPPYMWAPQPLLPPFGSPYAPIYSPGGVYSHPSAPITANPSSTDLPAKSASNKDKGPTKKLKGLDGISVSVDDENAENKSGADAGSGYNSTDGSSDGSSESGGNGNERKRSSDDRPTSDDCKVDKRANASKGRGTNSSKIPLSVTVATANVVGNPVGSVPSSGSGMDFDITKVKAIGTPVPPPAGVMITGRNGVPPELWAKDERELKRERRKQSNRESARRSRLRKQAETEELAIKVESLSAENSSLRSEINQLTENSEKLRLENSALMEKLKNAGMTQIEEVSPDKMETDGSSSVVVENFLSMIDNPNSASRGVQLDNKEPAKLRQLLGSSQRTDAVAAN